MGSFLNSFFGRYRNPKEEKRVFMFLDLNNSTTIAENLGHYKYSELIRDFFNDLNITLESYGAAVYQYVGDEAVVTWAFNRGIKNSKCVKFFFEFENQIDTRDCASHRLCRTLFNAPLREAPSPRSSQHGYGKVGKL